MKKTTGLIGKRGYSEVKEEAAALAWFSVVPLSVNGRFTFLIFDRTNFKTSEIRT